MNREARKNCGQSITSRCSSPESSGYRAAGSLGEWDLIGIGPADVVLVQVRTRDWPGTFERAVLVDFPVPPMTRKLCHRWRPRQRLPDVQSL